MSADMLMQHIIMQITTTTLFAAATLITNYKITPLHILQKKIKNALTKYLCIIQDEFWTHCL